MLDMVHPYTTECSIGRRCIRYGGDEMSQTGQYVSG